MPFRNLLVAVDGSEHSHRACELAGDLANHYGSHVVLLHIVHQPRGSVPAGVEEFERLEHVHITERDLLESAGTRILMDAESRARTSGATEVKRLLEFGHPAEIIIQYSKQHLFPGDAIIMGRRGLGDVASLVLGSISHRVTHGADSTVITVE